MNITTPGALPDALTTDAFGRRPDREDGAQPGAALALLRQAGGPTGEVATAGETSREAARQYGRGRCRGQATGHPSAS
jgi:hypothetical protein